MYNYADDHILSYWGDSLQEVAGSLQISIKISEMVWKQIDAGKSEQIPSD